MFRVLADAPGYSLHNIQSQKPHGVQRTMSIVEIACSAYAGDSASVCEASLYL